MNDYIINTKLEGEAEHDKSQEKLVSDERSKLHQENMG